MIWEDWKPLDPGSGEVRIRHAAVGMNFVGTYHRDSISHPWPVASCPLVIGFEGAGVVEDLGESVTGFSVSEGDARLAQQMAAQLLEDGIYVTGFPFPVVPQGKARIRT